ncbi:Ig-like domain-containing protein [Clostridium cibarium]|uniref:Ig-like domain repeat protein n=1 Tax=Clostridium cibarium TaxID=2762247 RepID=A0ABR8PPU8_9CLOT|nr:Ig-like domain repeat protein [Clostridium cibarium]
MSVKRRNNLIWCLVLFMAVFVGGISTIVYSSSSEKIEISLGDNKWSPNFTNPGDDKNTETLTDTWFVNAAIDRFFTVDLSNYFNEKNTDLKKIPFVITATLNNNDTLELTEENIKSDDKGIFTITLPDKINGKNLGDNDNNIKFDIKFNGEWNIPKATKTFNVTIDNVAPEFDFSNIKSEESSIDADIIINEADKDRIKEAKMIISENNLPGIVSDISFNDGKYHYKNITPGKYTIIMKVKDKAGNVSYDDVNLNPSNSITFYIDNKIKPITNLYKKIGDNISKEPIGTDKIEYVNTKTLDLYSKVGLPFQEYSYDIDGKSVIDLCAQMNFQERYIAKEFTKEITIEPTGTIQNLNVHLKDNKKNELNNTYKLFVDTQNPEATVTGLGGNTIDGVTYINAEKLDSTINISDETLESYTLTLYKDNNKISTTHRNNSKDIENDSEADASIKLNNEDDKSSSFALQVNSDGNYSINVVATDKAGNNINKDIKFVKDTQTPKVKVSDIKPVYSNTPEGEGYPEPVVDISDDNYGASIVKIKRNNEEVASATIDELGNFNKVEKEDISVEKDEKDNKFSFSGIKQDGKYTIDIYTKDKAGNEFDTTKGNQDKEVQFTIDKTDPSIDIKSGDSDIPESEETYYKEAQNINIVTSDDNLDSNGSKVSVTKDGKPFNKVPAFNSVDKEAKTSYKFDEDGKYELTVTSKDTAGNSSTKTVKFVIDNIDPEIKFEETSKYSKVKSDIKFTVKEANYEQEGISAECTKIIHHEGSKDTVISNIPLDFSKEETKDGIDTFKIDNDKFDEDATYEIKLNMTDLAGRKAEEQKATFTIDKTAPEIEIAGVDADSHYNTDKTVNIITTDDNQGTNTIEATKNGEKFKVNEFKVEGDKASTSYNFTEEGTYEITVNSVDKAGNDQSKNITFVVDKTSPVTKISSSADKFTNSDKSVTIDVADDYIDTAKVSISCTKKTPDGENNPSYDFIIDDSTIKEDENHKKYASNTYNFGEEGEYILTVTSTDLAGNIQKEPETIEFTVDKSAPQVSFQGITDGTHYNDSTKTVNIDVKDQNLNTDLGNNTVTVLKDGEEYKKDDLDCKEKEATKSYDFTEEGTYVLKVKSSDKAGNIAENNGDGTYDITFVIDRTAPAININDYDSLNNSFNNRGRDVTVSVTERYYDTDNVTVSYEKLTPDGNNVTVNPGFGANGVGEVTTQTYSEFNDDAQYTMTISATDKAGNTASRAVVFTTDKTNPSVSITGVDFDQYYNIDKTVTLKSTDVNERDNVVAVTKNGQGYNIGGFGLSGRDAELSYTFSEEGTYEINYTATDKAGNPSSASTKFTIDKTAPKITPMESVDGTEIHDGAYINKAFTPVFKLDNQEDTIESVTLNGGGNLAGDIPMASDETKYEYKVVARDKASNETTLNVGFTVDTTRPEIKVSGIMSGFFNKNLTPEYEITDTNLDASRTSALLNGNPFTSGTQLEDQENYNFKLSAIDLANNENNNTISFTIDKDKPVIRFETPMSGKYFTEDFVPNFIIDDLTDYTIISMTLDGEDYEKGDLITTEGKHVLFIEVQDKAGNTESVSVEFILDKTPPKFIVDGIEDGKTYYEATSASVKLDNPQDKINSVTVNGQLIENHDTDEYGQDVYKLDFNDIKDYKVVLNATDEAGNKTEEKINFKVADKTIITSIYTNKLILYPLVGGSVAAVAGVGTVLFRRRLKLKIK